MKAILVLAAVWEEALDIETALNKREEIRFLNTRLVKGFIGKKEVWILVSGPGVLNTAVKLSSLLSFFSFEWILQLGCGGMYPYSGLKMGEVAIAASELDLHLGLESDLILPEKLPFSIVEGSDKRRGLYHTDKRLLEKARQIFNDKEKFKFISGPFVTVSTISTKKETALAIAEESGGIIENMEGASAYHTAELYNTPIIALRAVSNPVGSRKKEDWDLKTAFKNASEAALTMLTLSSEDFFNNKR